MKKIIVTGLIMVTGLMANNFLSYSEIFEIINKKSIEENKKLPLRINEMRTLDKVTTKNRPLEIKYNFILNDYIVKTKGNADYIINYKNIKESEKIWKESFKSSLLKKACSGENRKLVDKGLSFKYEYKWETGEDVFTLTVNGIDCQKAEDEKSKKIE